MKPLRILAIGALIGIVASAASAQQQPSRDTLVAQVIQNQRNNAMDAVATCFADGQMQMAELRAQIDKLQRQLDEAERPKPDAAPAPQ